MISAIPGSDPPVVRVLCEEPSHHGRVATVAYLGRGRDGRAADLTVAVVDPRHPGAHWHEGQSHDNLRRGRMVLRCPLCDLTETMTQDRAGRLVDGCLSAGVTEVRLAAISAIV